MSVSSKVSGKPRVLLDALLEGPKSTAELAELLGSRHVATYVLRLRKALGSPDLVRTTFTGYELALPAQPVPVFQLPAPVGGFVGREHELARIVELVPQRPVVISGPPGIGKTALATVAGHALAEAFPDGQLYVNLRGYSPEPPLSPSVVLSRFLRALGMGPDRIPVELDALSEAFQALVRDARILVVLDNAASAEQVAALLPDKGSCGVLITSRADLEPFAVVRIGTLPPAEAAELVGGDDELARWCGYYPLALRIALGNLVGRPDPESYVDEVRADRLDALAVDGDAGVRRAFDLSYAALPPDEARLFGLLGVIPGPDFSVEAASALAGHPVSLDRLVAANLVQRVNDRFALHDLLRDYAAEQATGADEALPRLLRWYVEQTDRAAGILYPELTGGSTGNPAEAMAWLIAEQPNVLAAVRHCATRGPVELTWQLVDTVGGFFGAYGHTVEFVATAREALRAASESGNAEAQAAMLILLGGAHYNRNELRQALTVFREADQLGGMTRNPWVLGFCCALEMELGELDAARHTIERVRAMIEARHVPFLASSSLFGRGALARLTGDLPAAVAHQRAALRSAEESGLMNLRTAVLLELARCLPPAEAIPLMTEAAETGVPRLRADVLSELAVAHAAAGDVVAARDAVKLAFDVVAELGDAPRIESAAHHAHGVVLAALGSADEARTAFTLALDTALAAEAPYDVMRAHVGLGDNVAARAVAEKHGFGL